MATVIQIKRSTAATAPGTADLAPGELAYSQDKSTGGEGAILYIESVNADNSQAIHKVGGKYYTDMVDFATDSDVASTLVKRDANGDFTAGTLTADLVGDVTGNADSATALETARLIGGVSFDGSAAITLPGVNAAGNQDTTGNAATATALATGINIGGVGFDGTINITLPGVDAIGSQDTTGNAATATVLDVARQIGGVNFDGSADIVLPGVNAAGTQDTTGTAAAWTTARTITLGGDLSGSVSIDGSGDVTLTGTVTAGSTALGTDTTGNYVETVASDGTGGIVVTGGTPGEGTTVTLGLANTAVTAGTYGSITSVPQFTVGSDGRITNVTPIAIDTTFDIAGDTGTDTVGGGQALTFAGTTNEVTTVVTDNTVTVGLATNPTVQGNLTVDGNLVVSGATTTVESQTLSVQDPLIVLASGNDSTDAVDIGFYGLYDTSGSQDLYTGMFRDATDDKFRLFSGSEVAPTTTVDTAAAGYTVATLVANIEGNVTGTTTSISNHDTDALSEGSTNLYYTTARQNADADTWITTATLDGGTF